MYTYIEKKKKHFSASGNFFVKQTLLLFNKKERVIIMKMDRHFRSPIKNLPLYTLFARENPVLAVKNYENGF